MRKKLKLFLCFLLSYMYLPIVFADSGLDSNYESGKSVFELIFSSGSSLLSFFVELLKPQPGDSDYNWCHITLSIICIIIFYIFTIVNIFKLDGYRKRSRSKNMFLLLLVLFPTLSFSVFYLFTHLFLVFYVLILIFYMVVFNFVIKVMISFKLKKKMTLVKQYDKNFNVKDFNDFVFNTYKEIQCAWMYSELDRIKSLVSDEIFYKYRDQLDILKADNQQNIVEKIEFKSNKIVDLEIENNVEIIVCQLNVICYDYVIDDCDNVIKGDRDKKCKYFYRLTFNKKIGFDEYVLVKKDFLRIR